MPSLHKKSFAAEQLALRQKKKVSPVVWVLVGVVVVALFVGGYVMYQRSVKEEVETEQIKSIAVLPFQDMSQEQNQKYLGDGIAGAIINAINNVEELRVIDQTSSFEFRGKEGAIDEIGKTLNVEAVLEGSVHKSANRLRVMVQLIKVSDHSLFFTDTYEIDFGDIFAIQDSISFSIVKELKGELLSEEKTAIEKRYTDNLEAYELYLMATKDYSEEKRNRNIDLQEFYRQSLELLNQAIHIDPDFALAYCQRAYFYIGMAYTGLLTPDEGFQKARAEAVKALQIDDTLVETQWILMIINTFYDWDWPAVDRGFKKANELNPGFAEAHACYSEYLLIMGRFNEALEEAKFACSLSPIDRQAQFVLLQAYSLLGRYDDYKKKFDKAVELIPSFQLGYRVLGHLCLKQGKYEEALNAFNKIHELLGEWIVTDEWLAFTYTRLGKKEKAEKILQKWLQRSQKEYVPSMPLASMYIGLGDYNNAFKHLEMAYNERDAHLPLIKFWPDFDPIRSDQRFKALMKKMNLPLD